jgi:hypothetical protein
MSKRFLLPILAFSLVPSTALADPPAALGPRVDGAEALPSYLAPERGPMRRRGKGLIAGGAVVGTIGLASTIFGAYLLAAGNAPVQCSVTWTTPAPGSLKQAILPELQQTFCRLGGEFSQVLTALGGAFLGAGLLSLGGGVAMTVRGAQIVPVVAVSPSSTTIGFRF